MTDEKPQDEIAKRVAVSSTDWLALLGDVKKYIEECEVKIEGEWGCGDSLEELIRSGSMPQIYNRVCAVLSANAKVSDSGEGKHE